MYAKTSLAAAALLLPLSASAAPSPSSIISFQDGIIAEADGMHNIHIAYNQPLNGELSLHYGSCEVQSVDDCHHSLGKTFVGSHPLAKRHESHESQRPSKFVWLPPSDTASGGCLHAVSEGSFVGRSAPVIIMAKKSKRSIAAADIMDSEGPWFDGVAYLKAKQPDEVFVAAAKSKNIGIIGAGMAGLMTGHLLDSVGFYNWKIIEATRRLGGRVRTAYLDGTLPEDYQYQEMGPMRFPVSYTYSNGETVPIKDHQIVFQLADVLNQQNGNSSRYRVDFIRWIQSASGNPIATSATRPDGTTPSRGEAANNPAYRNNVTATYSNATAVAEAIAAVEEWTEGQAERIAENIYQAHKWAVNNGYLHFSEAQYLKYVLGVEANITDQAGDVADNLPTWSYEDVYFATSDWRTIDKGLNRLPRAFGPQVLNRTTFGINVQGLSWNATTEKMSIEYRGKDLYAMKPKTMEFDYIMVAVPFSKVRQWRRPSFTSLLTRAIARLNYSQSCKVALHYKTRFWESLPQPILGGCGSTSIPNIGSVCYPAYKLNSSLPGALLASYVSQVGARAAANLNEAEHIAYVQRAMVEIHGPIAAEQFTGEYSRVCWENDEFQAGAWASPFAGQQDLYIPSYFQTEKKTIFIGEHTSYTHAWIWSALESSVRGTAQLLLDMGLVDEAKQIVNFWMARWITM